MVFAAFLRGINVGGNNIVSMAELKICFENMGFEHVKTYINSGNVIFADSTNNSDKLAAKIERNLEVHFKLALNVVVKSLAEMQAVVRSMPKTWGTSPELRCNVLFLRPVLDSPDVLKAVSPRPGVDEVSYVPGAIFWSNKFSDSTRSGLQKVIGTSIYKEITIRNRNTTLKVYDLMQHVVL